MTEFLCCLATCGPDVGILNTGISKGKDLHLIIAMMTLILC